LLALCERFGYTHDDVARKVGKSRTTVTEALAIARIPDDVRDVCRGADITAKSSLLQIVRQPDDDSMRSLAKQIASRGLNRDDAREARRQEMGPRVVPDAKPYVFKYASPEKDFNVEVRFKATQVSDAEVALILRAVADEIDDEPATN
jgi:ParB family transcriptional regulator, chromosome partitioning protein